MTRTPSVSDLREELRAYYEPLLPFWDATLSDRGDLRFWRERAQAWSGGTVLELGCGSGRVTEVLADGADGVVGIDLNLEALRAARRRIPPGDRVRLVAADMRTLTLGRRFPAVVAANDPFSHLRSDVGRQEALDRAAALLEPGGTLVLDALWLSDEWLEEARTDTGRSLERVVDRGDEDGGELRVRQTWRAAPEGRICSARYEVWIDGELRGDGTFRGRCWSIDELRDRFERAGLRVDRLLGDYDGSAWHPDAPRLVAEGIRG